MKRSLELPPTLKPGDPDFLSILNDRFRQVQEAIDEAAGTQLEADLDAAGHRIINLGNPTGTRDAVPLCYLQRVGGGRGTGGGSTTITGQIAQAVFTVPGILGIQSSAAPLLSLPLQCSARSVVALLKQGPLDGAVELTLTVGVATWAVVTVADGGLAGRTEGAGLGPIPPDTLVRLDITGVGNTFPGADLTLMIRFV